MLDPKTLTPEQLYRLQSDTWAQGADYERERIIELLEEHTYYGQDGWLELSDKALTRADLEALIKGEQK